MFSGQQQLAAAQQQALNDAAQQDYYAQQQYDDYSYFGGGGGGPSSRYDDYEMDKRSVSASGKFSRKYPPPNFDNSVAIMVYGIDQDYFDCDRLFNLFCCYGNVSKVSLLN